MPIIINNEEFLKRAKEKHGDFYDYSEIQCNGIRSFVIIKCPYHGPFSQIVQAHIHNGQGCSKCFQQKRLTIIGFNKKACLIHNNKYDYSVTNLLDRDSNGKISIRCKEHDFIFLVRPADHIHPRKKYGCPKCGKNIKKTKITTRNKKNIIGTDEFIKRSIQIHGDLYNYEDVIYLKIDKQVIIKCKIHKEFLQTPREHLNGCGCPKCANSSTSKMEQAWLDNLRIPLDNRNKKLHIGSSFYIVDGIDIINKTVYEFLGDYWHGNPNVYDKNDLNLSTKFLTKVFLLAEL